MKLKPKKQTYQRGYALDEDGRLMWKGEVYESRIKCQGDITRNAPANLNYKYGVASIMNKPSYFEDCYFVNPQGSY
jgi:hypothetical protein